MAETDHNEQRWERIERYLRNEMHGDERSGFEQEISEDETLRKEVALHRLVHESLGDPDTNAFRRTLGDVADRWHKAGDVPAGPARRISPVWRIIGIAATVLIAVGVFLWIDKADGGDPYDAYFEPYAMVLTERAATDTTVISRMVTTGVRQYTQGDFRHAAETFANLNNSAPDIPAYLFYEGVAWLGAGEYDRSIKVLRSLLEKPDHLLLEQGRWYLALALGQSGDVQGARAALESIQQGEFKYDESREILRKY